MRCADETPRRKPRTWCPKRTPRKRPQHISQRHPLGGKCDFNDVYGNSCRHWKAKDSWACYCHREEYEKWKGRWWERNKLFREGRVDDKGNRLDQPEA